jgi:signal transduction histidine kinase
VLEVLAPDGLPPLPAAVEVAAYRIAIEAVTNAVRHGRPGSVRCRIGCCGDRLAVEVSDDGGGIPRDIVEGVGLGSMRERAEELGGSCCISALPAGGTLVRAELPIGRR